MADARWTCPNTNCGVSNDSTVYRCRTCNEIRPYATEPGQLSSGIYHANESSGIYTTQEKKMEQVKLVEQAIDHLLEELGKEDGQNKPLNILLIGKPGVGKSEFINSTAAALSRDKWKLYADSGKLSASEPITIRMKKHPKCCNAEQYKEWLLPSLIDVAGLGDEGGEAVTELLLLLLYGHIKETTPVQTVYNDCNELPLQDLRHKYRKSYDDMRVDRVIFVASCEDDLPEELMKCVRKAVKPPHDSPQKREVPLTGVLTKKDKVNEKDEEFKRKRERFKLLLGLDNTRLVVCSNYCDDIDREKERLKNLRPDLDLPIVDFYKEVCSRALAVTNDDDRLAVPGILYNIRKRIEAIGPVPTTVIIALLVAAVAYAVGTLLLPSSGQEYEAMSRACREGLINDTEVCSQLPEGKSPWSPWCLLLAIVAGLAVCVYRYLRHHAPGGA